MCTLSNFMFPSTMQFKNIYSVGLQACLVLPLRLMVWMQWYYRPAIVQCDLRHCEKSLPPPPSSVGKTTWLRNPCPWFSSRGGSVLLNTDMYHHTSYHSMFDDTILFSILFFSAQKHRWQAFWASCSSTEARRIQVDWLRRGHGQVRPLVPADEYRMLVHPPCFLYIPLFLHR